MLQTLSVKVQAVFFVVMADMINPYWNVFERNHAGDTGFDDLAKTTNAFSRDAYTAIMWFSLFICVLSVIFVLTSKFIIGSTMPELLRQGKKSVVIIFACIIGISCTVAIFTTVVNVGQSFSSVGF